MWSVTIVRIRQFCRNAVFACCYICPRLAILLQSRLWQKQNCQDRGSKREGSGSESPRAKDLEPPEPEAQGDQEVQVLSLPGHLSLPRVHRYIDGLEGQPPGAAHGQLKWLLATKIVQPPHLVNLLYPRLRAPYSFDTGLNSLTIP